MLFMASEQEFWQNFCSGVDRLDLFERWPGSRYGDHARGNRELQAILRDTFRTRTAAARYREASYRSCHGRTLVPLSVAARTTPSATASGSGWLSAHAVAHSS